MTPIANGLLAAGLLLSTLAGCQQAPRSRASAAASTACQADVDRVYAAQNRAELSTRDQRDTPFAAGYVSGITSQGLGARYSRDNMLTSCLNNSASPAAAPAGAATAPGTGPVFTPTVR